MAGTAGAGPSLLLLLCSSVAAVLLRAGVGEGVAWQLPRWDPVWQLNRSTIAQPCNNSGWLGPELPGGGDIGEFGLLSFDWANNRANWSAQQPNRCEEDLVAQAVAAEQASRAHPGPETKVFVYRGGEMCLNFMTDQRELMGDLPSHPSGSFAEYPYKGYWVAYTNGTIWANRPACHGHCMGQLIWDFRDKSAADYYVNTVVGSTDFGVGNPHVDGMFLDDIAGLGTELPGLLDDLDWTPRMVEDWNKAANETVARARELMLSKKKYNWQMFAEMAAPARSTCENGSTIPPRPGQLPFPGMKALCSASAPAAKQLPWLMHVFSGRGLDADQFSCQPKIGVVDCPKLPEMEQKIAAFLLGRGDYAYMGYSWAGCANGVKSPWNNSGGTQFWAPSRWSPTMAYDFGAPLEPSCREVSPGSGVFERKYAHRTVRLDCTDWTASFELNANTSPGTPSDGGDSIPAGGYGGLGVRLPRDDASATNQP